MLFISTALLHQNTGFADRSVLFAIGGDPQLYDYRPTDTRWLRAG
jgi:hypothetical protein